MGEFGCYIIFVLVKCTVNVLYEIKLFFLVTTIILWCQRATLQYVIALV